MFDALIDTVKGFIPKLIGLVVAILVARLIYELAINPEGFNAIGLVESLATTVAASVLTLLVVASLDNAK